MSKLNLFLCILIAAIFFSAQTSAVSTETKPPVITIGHVGHDHHIALYVAALEGERLSKHGVWMKEKKEKEVYDLIVDGKPAAELHLIKVGGGSEMPAAMERNEIHVGFGGFAAIAVAHDKGNPFKIICPLQTDGDMLVFKKLDAVKDWDSFIKFIKGSKIPVKIGYKAPDAVAKLIFVASLKEIGIPFRSSENTSDENKNKPGSIEMINLQGEKNMVPSLEAGAVDGFVVNQPHASLASTKGVGVIVEDLADLPPEGRWKNHPCCCICAPESVIKEQRAILVSFMKLMLVSTDLINADKTAASKLASQWTKMDEKVELDSIPSINYLASFTDDYRKGVEVYGEMMHEIGKFKGTLKDKKGKDFFNALCDTTIIEEAEASLKKKGSEK